ncbi:unnamed protein product [Cylicocyclus nassatus]|uniref:Uncharacterized protein n=1 Tax=Cylicocyclus nassatus TaxID=53992 RepID=A0AA36H2R0_CYLNA|nr:unnamed protein product [Cylicocyclus nassatus]
MTSIYDKKSMSRANSPADSWKLLSNVEMTSTPEVSPVSWPQWVETPTSPNPVPNETARSNVGWMKMRTLLLARMKMQKFSKWSAKSLRVPVRGDAAPAD